MNVIPAPASSTPLPGTSFPLNPNTRISAAPGPAAAEAERLARLLRTATGLPLPVGPAGEIVVTLGEPASLGPEGYLLDVGAEGVGLRAHAPAGLFRGSQTLLQLVPPASGEPLPGVRISDRPRFAWRGVMLDVARHFFPVSDVKRLIGLVAPYKINTLHLHLTDDQGWRLAIDGWPRLTSYGAVGEVGGGAGGFYGKEDFAEIVRFAAEHHMTVVPEIDMPGHTNAALASYPELNADGISPARYSGMEVGFSSLNAADELTYRFVDEVLGELAGLTPGPYLHVGGDEAHSTSAEDYRRFMERLGPIVTEHGKSMVAWQEAAAAPLPAGALVQFWRRTDGDEPAVVAAVRNGAKVIMSPAPHTYLDLKYDAGTELGQDWAGYVEVQDSYGWDPAAHVGGVTEPDVVGVEAALWTETLVTGRELEYMTFPRLPAVAEVGWSPQEARSWPDFAARLAAHASRWTTEDITYHRSPGVPWPA